MVLDQEGFEGGGGARKGAKEREREYQRKFLNNVE